MFDEWMNGWMVMWKATTFFLWSVVFSLWNLTALWWNYIWLSVVAWTGLLFLKGSTTTAQPGSSFSCFYFISLLIFTVKRLCYRLLIIFCADFFDTTLDIVSCRKGGFLFKCWFTINLIFDCFATPKSSLFWKLIDGCKLHTFEWGFFSPRLGTILGKCY